MALIDEKPLLLASVDGTETFCLFWGQASPFSNWRACKFEIDGFEYTSGEQRMMHAKAVFFGDMKSAEAVFATPSPWRQKTICRGITPYDDELWSKVRLEMVIELCHAKAKQDPEILAYLMSTAGTTIVEASLHDKVWGIGLRADDPDAIDRSKWQGANLLGIAWTKTRELFEHGIEPARSACSLSMDQRYEPIAALSASSLSMSR